MDYVCFTLHPNSYHPCPPSSAGIVSLEVPRCFSATIIIGRQILVSRHVVVIASRANPLQITVCRRSLEFMDSEFTGEDVPTIYEMAFGKVDEPLSDLDEDCSSPGSGGTRQGQIR